MTVSKSNWVCITTPHDWLKYSCHSFIQSEVKLSSVVTDELTFSRPFCQLHVFALSFDWFTVLYVSSVIG